MARAKHTRTPSGGAISNSPKPTPELRAAFLEGMAHAYDAAAATGFTLVLGNSLAQPASNKTISTTRAAHRLIRALGWHENKIKTAMVRVAYACRNQGVAHTGSGRARRIDENSWMAYLKRISS